METQTAYQLDYLALYAAIVATVALGWRIYEWYQQKPHIRVKTSFAHFINVPHKVPNKVYMSVTAMNFGHRPTTLSKAGIDTTRGKYFQLIEYYPTRQLPRRLEEGENCQVFFDIVDLKDKISKEGIRVKSAWFCDEAERYYKGKLSKHLKKALRP